MVTANHEGAGAIMTGTMPAQPNKAYMTQNEFRDLLRDADLKQGAAADELGVSRQTVVRWLSGYTPISKANAMLIRSVLKKKTRRK